MILILVDAETERLRYTLDFIFKVRGLDYATCTSLIEFEEKEVNYRLNYSDRHCEIAKHIPPSTLLRESHIRTLTLKKAEFEEEECLEIDGIVDPLAAVFFTLTRYEEYTCRERDEYNRFPAKQSVLLKFEWQEKAMCDRWARKIIEFIFPELYLEAELRSQLTRSTKLIPTFDIDNAYAYLYKSNSRTFLSRLKDILLGNKDRIQERRSVVNGGKDPYDTYDFIEQLAKEHSETRIFWLTRSNGKKDRNVPLSCHEHKDLIRRMSACAQIGLHPSFDSFLNRQKVSDEKRDLESILNAEIRSTRFHYLRFQLPASYRVLSELGFQEEHSMGFAEAVGFRCGTARAHQWFDCERNEETKLQVHPFAYMDGSLNEYMELKPEEAILKIQKLYREVKDFGGDFRFIWHNETINEKRHWLGWRSVLEETLNLKK